MPEQPYTRWPARQTFALSTVGILLFAVYWSLIPFDFQPLPAHEAAARFSIALAHLPSHPPLQDFVANLCFFAIVGTLVSGTLSLDRGSGTKALSALASGLGILCLSLTLEFAQVFFPDRVVSASDVLADSAGGLAGGLLWLAGGQRLVGWIRAQASEGEATLDIRHLPRPLTGEGCNRLLTWRLVPWALVVLACHWFPFHFVLRLDYVKGRLSTLSWIPLIGFYYHEPFDAVSQFFLKIGVAAPLGIMVGRRLRARDVECDGTRTLKVGSLALVFFAAVEGGQVLLPERFPDVGDVLVGTLGVILALVLSARFAAGRRTVADTCR